MSKALIEELKEELEFLQQQKTSKFKYEQGLVDGKIEVFSDWIGTLQENLSLEKQ